MQIFAYFFIFPWDRGYPYWNLPYRGMFRECLLKRFWNAQNIPVSTSESPTKSAPYMVVDFKKRGFSFRRGTKRNQYFRIGEYFNEG